MFLHHLQVDPHCSYKASVAVSASAAAKRFLLVYGSEVNISTALISLQHLHFRP